MRVREKKGRHVKMRKKEICVSRKRRADTRKDENKKLRVEKKKGGHAKTRKKEICVSGNARDGTRVTSRIAAPANARDGTPRKHPDLLRKSG